VGAGDRLVSPDGPSVLPKARTRFDELSQSAKKSGWERQE
jgi:hypothetical protein